MKSFRFARRFAAGLALASAAWISTATTGHAAEQNYYFSTGGDDRNDGLTSDRPRRSLDDLSRLLAPGVTVRLKRGDVWHVPGLTWDLTKEVGTGGPPMRIGAYGDERLPAPALVSLARVDRMQWNAGHDRSSSIAAADRSRLYSSGRALRRVPAGFSLEPGTFRAVDGRLEFRVEGVAGPEYLELAAEPAPPLVRVRGTTRLVLEDVEFRGEEGWSAVRIVGGGSAVEMKGVSLASYPPPTLNNEPTGRLSPGTYYFASDSGSVAGNGTQASPWLSVGKIDEWIAPGVTILLERGSVWYDPTLVWNFSYLNASSSSPMRIGAYGNPSDPRPVVAKMVLDPPADWDTTSVSNRFRTSQYFATTGDSVYRLYVGGTPFPKVSGLGALVNDSYCIDNGKIVVQIAGATQKPTVESIQHYNGNGIYGWGAKHLTIEDIQIKGGDGIAAILFPWPSESVVLRNLAVHQTWGSGLTFARSYAPPTNPLERHIDATVEDCVVDQGWSAGMNTEYRHTVAGRLNGADGEEWFSAGVYFAESVEGAVVRGCTVTGFGHGGIEFNAGADTSVAFVGIRDVLIEENMITAGTSHYCRGLAISGPTNVTDIVVRRNYIYDQNVQSQIGGYGNVFYSNIWDVVNAPTGSGKQWAGGTLGYFAGYTPKDTAIVIRDCVFANNTFYSSGTHMRMAGFANDGVLSNGNVFANNLVIDWRPLVDVNDTRLLTGALTFDSTHVSSFTFQNNGFWDAEGQDKVLLVKRAYPVVDSYTVAAFNARSNADGNVFSAPSFVGGSGDNPLNFRLSSSSPYRNGGIPLSQLLPAGVDTTDFFGNPFHSNPSRGAIQYAWTALTSVAITGGPSGPIETGTQIQVASAPTPSNAEVQTFAWVIKRNGTTQQTGSASTFSYTPGVTGTYIISLTATDWLGNVRNATPDTIDVWPPPSIMPTIIVGGNQAELEEGATIGQEVTVTASNFTSTSATRNGSPINWPGSGSFWEDGYYVFTANGTQQVQRTFTIDHP